MVSTRKKRPPSRRFLNRLDDFEQDIIIGNAAIERQENLMVNERANDRDFTVSTSGNCLVTNENTVNVKTLERCFNERIDGEMSKIVDTVENRIQNAILTAIDTIVAPKIELAIRSINASCGQYATSVVANSERGEHVGINGSIENASGNNNNVLHVSNVIDETRINIPDEVSELSVPETRFDRQTRTHHNNVISRPFSSVLVSGILHQIAEIWSRSHFSGHYTNFEPNQHTISQIWSKYQQFTYFQSQLSFLLCVPATGHVS